MKKFGFHFEDRRARKNAFQAAKDFFEKHENHHAMKIKRRQWITFFPNDRDHPMHSFIRIPPDDKIFAIADGQYGGLIGQGNYGRVKYAMDENGEIYALKIERTNNALQQQESLIAKHVGLMSGNKLKRGGGSFNDVTKYYSVLEYLGVPLQSRLTNVKHPLNFTEKIKIARKLSYALHKLHVDKQCAHGDLKPSNVTIDSYGNVHLIDFGFASIIATPATPFLVNRGTPKYLAYIPDDGTSSTLALKRINQEQLSKEQVDTFALKKTLYWHPDYETKPGDYLFTQEEMIKLPQSIQDLINVSPNDVDQAIQDIKPNTTYPHGQTPLLFTIAFLHLEMQPYNSDAALYELTVEQQIIICQSWELLDSIESKHPQQIDIIEDVQCIKQFIADHPHDIVQIQHDVTQFIECHLPVQHQIDTLMQRYNDLHQKIQQTLHDNLHTNSANSDRASLKLLRLSTQCSDCILDLMHADGKPNIGLYQSQCDAINTELQATLQYLALAPKEQLIKNFEELRQDIMARFDAEKKFDSTDTDILSYQEQCSALILALEKSDNADMSDAYQKKYIALHTAVEKHTEAFMTRLKLELIKKCQTLNTLIDTTLNENPESNIIMLSFIDLMDLRQQCFDLEQHITNATQLERISHYQKAYSHLDKITKELVDDLPFNPRKIGP